MIYIIIERSAPTMQVVQIIVNKPENFARDMARKLEKEKKVFDVDVLLFDTPTKMNEYFLENLEPKFIS